MVTQIFHFRVDTVSVLNTIIGTMLESMPIPSIPGAVAFSDGTIKFPDGKSMMPHGVMRDYKTKRIRGVLRRSAKNARHAYYGTFHVKYGNLKIHRLICEAFHGAQPADRPVVLHLDENGLNNRPENLRWGTQKENLNMPGFIAYCKSRTGANSPMKKHLQKKALGF